MKHYMKFIKPVLLLVLFMSFFIMVSLNAYASEKEGSQVQRKADYFIEEGPEFIGSTIEHSKSEIINRLGKPLSIKSEKVRNPHNDTMDTIYKLKYVGLYIEVYEVSLDERSFVLYIILENKKYKTKWGISIGTTKERIRAVLGKPDKNDETSWTYVANDGYPDTVKFYFVQEGVKKIEWCHIID